MGTLMPNEYWPSDKMDYGRHGQVFGAEAGNSRQQVRSAGPTVVAMGCRTSEVSDAFITVMYEAGRTRTNDWQSILRQTAAKIAPPWGKPSVYVVNNATVGSSAKTAIRT